MTKSQHCIVQSCHRWVCTQTCSEILKLIQIRKYHREIDHPITETKSKLIKQSLLKNNLLILILIKILLTVGYCLNIVLSLDQSWSLNLI